MVWLAGLIRAIHVVDGQGLMPIAPSSPPLTLRVFKLSIVTPPPQDDDENTSAAEKDPFVNPYLVMLEAKVDYKHSKDVLQAS
eukprot:scaffold10182_cov144-Chaetoceros_neogracile.AAC.3